jgi:hypothetical protein
MKGFIVFVLIIRYSTRVIIEEDDTDWVCGTHGKDENCI